MKNKLLIIILYTILIFLLWSIMGNKKNSWIAIGSVIFFILATYLTDFINKKFSAGKEIIQDSENQGNDYIPNSQSFKLVATEKDRKRAKALLPFLVFGGFFWIINIAYKNIFLPFYVVIFLMNIIYILYTIYSYQKQINTGETDVNKIRETKIFRDWDWMDALYIGVVIFFLNCISLDFLTSGSYPSFLIIISFVSASAVGSVFFVVVKGLLSGRKILSIDIIITFIISLLALLWYFKVLNFN